ncbi:MAG: DUF2271 domain-containing protein, partial [Clostridiales bacterium]|nr:DUF2271 domain-containing protein [Clostridiales bacterium]
MAAIMTVKLMRKFFAVVAAMVLLAALCACTESGKSTPPVMPAETPDTLAAPSQQADDAEPSAPTIMAGEVIITFEYQKQSGSASNQFAVWIEDMDGHLIKTLYATRYTANGGYKNRPDSIPLWVEKSGLASLTKSEIDAVSSATPKAGALSYAWDLTDINGVAVAPGEYKFFVEGTLRWKNSVLYSGVIAISDQPVTVIAGAEFTYEATDRQAALT